MLSHEGQTRGFHASPISHISVADAKAKTEKWMPNHSGGPLCGSASIESPGVRQENYHSPGPALSIKPPRPPSLTGDPDYHRMFAEELGGYQHLTYALETSSGGLQFSDFPLFSSYDCSESGISPPASEIPSPSPSTVTNNKLYNHYDWRIRKKDQSSISGRNGHLRCKWQGCGYSGVFSRAADLMRHVKELHVDPGSHRCSIEECCKVFNRKDNLRDHYRRAHSSSRI